MITRAIPRDYRKITLFVMGLLFCIYVLFHSRILLYLKWLAMSITGHTQAIILPDISQIAYTWVVVWLLFITIYAGLYISESVRVADFDKYISFGLSVFALITVPAALIGEIAERTGVGFLKPPFGPLLCSIPALIICAVSFNKGWRPHLSLNTFSYGSKLIWGTVLLVACTYIATIAISLIHPATGGDALSYHSPLAVLLWREGNLGSFLEQAQDIWALAHPGMAELWFGLLRVGGGEWLANLGQLPFTLLGVAAIYSFTRRLGLKSGSAILAGLAFMVAPMVVMQSVMQQNDIVGAAMLMVTIALASAPSDEWNIDRIILIGLGMGMTVVTKLVLLPSIAGVGIYVVGMLFLRLSKGKSWRSFFTNFVVLCAAFLLVVSPWWVRNIIRYQNPIFPSAIPLIGRGVFLADLGRIDISFVPSPLAWPLYPLIEPHDDRSGFGALFMISAIPGYFLALLKLRRQPLLLFSLVTIITVPAWWIFTLHEPRFFLGLVGLSFAFISCALLVIPKQLRPIGYVIIFLTAVFSISVTFDQDILTFAKQPNDRATFYDRVWGVDPYATTLPEDKSILLNTGFAPTIFEYTATYPLLGARQDRIVLPIDGAYRTEEIVDKMRKNDIDYVYVASAAENVNAVKAIYNPAYFELIHQSSIVVGEKSGARRVLYRIATTSEQDIATHRYVFRLK